jgi:hypothetical protein
MADGSIKTRLRWLDAVARDPDMRGLPTAIAVQLAINYFNSTTGLAWPAHSTLAKRLGANPRSIQRALDALVEAGWLKRAVGGRQESNRYWMIGVGHHGAETDGVQTDGSDARRGRRTRPEGDGPDAVRSSEGTLEGTLEGPPFFDSGRKGRDKHGANERMGFQGSVNAIERWLAQRKGETD